MVAAIKKLAGDLEDNGGSILSLYYLVSQDETPMKIAVRDHASSIRTLLDAGQAVQRLTDLSKNCESETGAHKLLNRRFKIAVLAKIPVLGYKLFVWDPPAPYRSMASTSSSSYYLHMLEDELRLGLPDLKALCCENQRLSFSDGDQSIERAERARHLDNTDETLMRRQCGLHSAEKIVE